MLMRMAQSPDLERPFLRKAEAGQGHAFGRLGDFYFHHRRIRRRDFGGPQHRILREHFAVHLGDEMILAGCVLTPDLSELMLFTATGFP